MKTVGETTRPFNYDLSHIPYNYTVEVTNRSERVPEELWMEVHDIGQKAGIKTIPKDINAKRQNGWLKRPY